MDVRWSSSEPTFYRGIGNFSEIAAEYKKPEDMSDFHYICSPCVDCCNEKKTQDIE
jgi:hypothetical protein